VIADFVAQLGASLFGGIIADRFIGRRRGNAARHGTFLCGLRVVSGRQAGLSSEWLVGEWRIRRGRLRLDELEVPIKATLAGSRRNAHLSAIIGGGDTVIFTVRTDTAELEWSILRKFDALALRALAVPQSTAERLP
jgi:hypothetical protein